MDDLDKYVLEQAKIEVEHTRSWPTKILAFYVAINAAIVTAVFSLAARPVNPVPVPQGAKWVISLGILILLAWALKLLAKNHESYLQYRNLQIHFQTANAKELGRKFPLPPEWLVPNELKLSTRRLGWGFYGYLVVLVGALGLAGLWVS